MKKGQAAMEFLMTYGWAILVVLVAIGALAYFGVLSPSRFMPKSCTFEPGIGCDDFKASAAGDIQLILANGKGESLTAVTAAISGCSADGNADGNDTWIDGEKLGGATGITLTGCGAATVGDRIKKTITLTYTSASGIVHTASGELTGKIEA